MLLEDKNGKGRKLKVKVLEQMISEMKWEIELVVVSSCHSESAGKLFQQAGVKHVVCIREEFGIKDAASILFA